MSLTQLTDLQPTNIKVTGIATFDQTVGIAGTLTYEDVTNIDSIGIITARSGVDVTGDITATGDVRIQGTYPNLTFVDTNNDSDFRITNANGKLLIYDITNSATRFTVQADGHIDINGDLDCLSGLDVDGQTNLDHTSIVGIVTISAGVNNEGLRITGQNNNAVIFTSPSINSSAGYRLNHHPATNVLRVDTTDQNGTFSGTVASFSSAGLDMADNIKLRLGTSQDLTLYHYGNDAYIDNATGSIIFRQGGSEKVRITSAGILELERGSEVNQAIDIKTTATTGASRIRFLEAGTDKAQIAYSHTNDQLEIIGATGNAVALFAGGTQKATLTSDGKFGVGITNHTHLIEAYGVDASIAVHNSGNARGGLCAMTNQRLALATTVVNDDLVFGYSSSNPLSSGAFVERMKIDNGTGDVLPGADNDQDLGSSSKRWANIYSADLQLSNIGTGGNEVDGSEGSWTLQEAEDTIYMINRKNGKRYKIKMEEV